MDKMSWRAELAKSNINILSMHDNMIFLEFTYHPKPGVFKWCKTVFDIPHNVWDPFSDSPKEDGSFGEWVRAEVLSLREELEG